MKNKKYFIQVFFALSAALCLTSLASGGVKPSIYGTLPNGEQVIEYMLSNGKGVELSVITYGGIITSLKTPDKHGKLADIVLGYDDLAGYLSDSSYFGALIGRYGNRIGKAQFKINAQAYQLDKNNGENHLHGGHNGFDKRNWYGIPFEKEGETGVKLALLSEDGDQGYPGNLAVEVVYTLSDDNELMMEYSAYSDKPTHVNLTQHSYFNLAGEGVILDHKLMIAADSITPVSVGLIPTGDFLEVKSTAFDFRKIKAIGKDIKSKHPQMKYGLGYDHNFVLNKSQPGAFELAAKVVEPKSGRILELYTEEPAIQFYSGNFLDGQSKGKGTVHQHRSGFCLEPQHFPDTPNKSEFPSTLLKPGERYSTRMSYKFLVIK